jgi:anti-sigma factor RsiW
MNVEPCSLLDAYHDGELDARQRLRFEEHLQACPSCAADLAQLRLLSRLLQQSPLPQIPLAALTRLHDMSAILRQRGTLRIAEWLTAAAAAVLVLGLYFHVRQPPAVAQPVAVAEPWELTAVYAHVVPADDTASTDPLLLADAVMSGHQYPWTQIDD